jgi:pimeloyl-ACP methyl ester carboxylesterase
MATALLRPQKSTTVRLNQTPGALRLAFNVLERVAPQIGARWAEYLWFRLPRRARSRRPLTGGTAFTVDVGGRAVAGMAWGSGPNVYLVHGWAGHAGQLVPFVTPLVESGFRAVAFDAPSHGASAPGAYGPRSSTALEFVHALRAVVAAQGPAAAIVAHSLGATATAVALCDGLAAERLIMVAPMASAAAYARDLTVALGGGERIVSRLITRIERRAGVPLRHFEVSELGRAVAMPPTLIVHDRDDTSTGVGDGEAIATAWPGAQLTVTSGLGHRRILRDPAVVAEVVGFASLRAHTAVADGWWVPR